MFVMFRTLFVQTCLIACLTCGVANQAWAQAPQQFSASGASEVATTIAAFKAAIGGANNGAVTGSQPTGFRQITWDDVPDNLASPNEFPVDYYNTTSPRGLLMAVVGLPYFTHFRVSADAANPSSAAPLFGDINAAYPALFTAYSPERIFNVFTANPFYIGGGQFKVDFHVAGSTTPATVSGFGAVFTDVNLANVSSLEYLDADGRSLGKFFVPPAAGHQTVSFLGVLFPTARVSSVIITAGMNDFEDATHDAVALDDFVYAEPQRLTPPTVTITEPAVPAITSTSPFVSLVGTASNVVSMTWSNDRGGSGSATSPTVFARLTDWQISNVPLAVGTNVITVTATNSIGTTTASLTVTVDVLTYYLAEGATGGFFDTDISIANPNATPAPVTIAFDREDGARISQTDVIPALSRKTVHVDTVPGVEATAFSTTAISTNGLPLVVERAMFWDASYYGGKGAAAIDQPSATWYFAEGVQNSFFNTFVLLQNPQTVAVDATLTFALQFAETPVIRTVTLPPLSRTTIDAGTMPALVGRSFGLTVQANQPIVAERTTYFESTPVQLWSGGHGSPGVTALANTWFFAEGATTAFRDTFLLLNNPHDEPVPFGAYFLLGNRTQAAYVDNIAPHSRLTLVLKDLDFNHINSQGPKVFLLGDPQFAQYQQFAVKVLAQQPIVAERAMYWMGAPGPWADGTTVFGVTSPGLKWGFAEGRVGGPLAFHTYIRVASFDNIGSANVKITFLKQDGTTIEQTTTIPNNDFFTLDVNSVPGLQNGDTFGTIVESTNGATIVAERSMYWDSNGNFWAGGLATAGTRLP
jgi:hypothetical protein